MKLLNFTNASRVRLAYLDYGSHKPLSIGRSMGLDTADVRVAGQLMHEIGALVTLPSGRVVAGLEPPDREAYEEACARRAQLFRAHGFHTSIEPEPTPEEIAQAEAARLDAAYDAFRKQANEVVTDLLADAAKSGIPQLNAGSIMFDAVCHFGNPPAR